MPADSGTFFWAPFRNLFYFFCRRTRKCVKLCRLKPRLGIPGFESSGQRGRHYFLNFLEMRGKTCRKKFRNGAQKKSSGICKPGWGLPGCPVIYCTFQTIDQVLPTPGGRDSGRLGSSVRTCLAEAATAADLKRGSGGAKRPQQKKV